MKIREITQLSLRMLRALMMEGVETTRMVKVFARQGSCKLRISPEHRNPTPEELDEAMEQFKDIPRILPFFMVVALPIPGILEGYTIAALILERRLGDRMSFLPSQFRNVLRPEAKGLEGSETKGTLI